MSVFVQTMTRLLGLRKQVTSQDKRNVALAASNTSLRKQVAASSRIEVEYKEKVASLEKELDISMVAQTAS